MKISKKYHIRKNGVGKGLIRKNPTFERGCLEDVSTGLTISPGESGRGVYAYIPSRTMRAYYTSRGETLVRIIPHENAIIIDLTQPNEMSSLLNFARKDIDDFAKKNEGYIKPKINSTNIQRFGSIIQSYIYIKHPKTSAYILPHRGPGTPTGKQAVILKMDDFSYLSL